MPTPVRTPPAAAILGCLTFLLIGWTGLLVPTLIRSVEASFGQGDAGLGGYFLAFGAGYGAGVLGGSFATEWFGRRRVLLSATVLLAAGLLVLGTTGSWLVFVLGAVPFGIGQGALDGGGNALILDLFPLARGRALNLLHLAFSVGALACPLVVGALVAGGLAWPTPLVVTGLVALPLAAWFAVADMPTGRRGRATAGPSASAPGEPGTAAGPTIRRDVVLLALGAAMATYVAAEVGVSDWLVRFLQAAPLEMATAALTLYWAGLAVGRLGAARIGNRVDHRAFAMVAAVATGCLFVVGIVAPSTELSILAFGLAGVASGPIFPLIVAAGGERYPDRSAAVGGYLAAAAVVGGLSYPSLMGVLSTRVGLPIAMLGTAVLTFVSAAVLWSIGAAARSATRSLGRA